MKVPCKLDGSFVSGCVEAIISNAAASIWYVAPLPIVSITRIQRS
jgi:hypothetical protein